MAKNRHYRRRPTLIKRANVSNKAHVAIKKSSPSATSSALVPGLNHRKYSLFFTPLTLLFESSALFLNLNEFAK